MKFWTKNIEQEQEKQGFTMIEMLISVAILSLAIGGALSLIQSSVGFVNETKERMIATYLANEAIEIIRGQRDTNLLSGLAWDNGFSPSSAQNCVTANGCRVSVLNASGGIATPPRIERCTGSCNVNHPFMRLQTNPNGMYGHFSGGSNTLFYRKVRLFNAPGEQYQVVVSVRYGGANDPTSEVVVQEIIRNL